MCTLGLINNGQGVRFWKCKHGYWESSPSRRRTNSMHKKEDMGCIEIIPPRVVYSSFWLACIHTHTHTHTHTTLSSWLCNTWFKTSYIGLAHSLPEGRLSNQSSLATESKNVINGPLSSKWMIFRSAHLPFRPGSILFRLCSFPSCNSAVRWKS